MTKDKRRGSRGQDVGLLADRYITAKGGGVASTAGYTDEAIARLVELTTKTYRRYKARFLRELKLIDETVEETVVGRSGILERLMYHLGTAQRSVVAMAHDWTHVQVAKKLVELMQNGAAVTLIADKTIAHSKYVIVILNFLILNGAEIYFPAQGVGVHSTLFSIDDRLVIDGSFTISGRGLGKKLGVLSASVESMTTAARTYADARRVVTQMMEFANEGPQQVLVPHPKHAQQNGYFYTEGVDLVDLLPDLVDLLPDLADRSESDNESHNNESDDEPEPDLHSK